MYNLYIDEKGPQNRFRKSKKFTMEEKLRLANDKMHSYAANALLVSERNYKDLAKEFLLLEQEYISKRNQLRGQELKGYMLLDNVNFEFGVASLRQREISFYNSLLSILEKYEVSNLFFTINKMAIIVTGRLDSWVLELNSLGVVPDPAIFLYAIIKYVDIEAPENIINLLLDESSSIEEILNSLKLNLQEIVNNNIGNSRMATQLPAYEEIILLISKYAKVNNAPSNKNTFDWSKFAYALDLWVTESTFIGERNSQEINVFLDEGIKKEHLERLKFKSIVENADSKGIEGLRITDHLVVLLGNYLNRLRADSMYDHNNPTETKRVSKKWFDLSEEQFFLVKRMYNYFLGDGKQYGFINDTYFDESVNVQSFLEYVGKFEKYEDFNSIITNHPENHFLVYYKIVTQKWGMSNLATLVLKDIGIDYKEAINQELLRPL